MVIFANHQYLALLWLVPLIPLLYALMRSQRKKRLRRLGDEDLDYVTSFADFEAAEGEYIHGVRFGKDVTLTLDAGTYFIAFYLEDEYWSEYNEPSYYLVTAEW